MFARFWKKKENKREWPAFWRRYQERIREEVVDRRRPIETATFVVFDTETTGLDIRRDRILSIGAVRVCGRQIELQSAFELMLSQPRRPAGTDSIPIHGILPVNRELSVTEAEAAAAFVDYAGASILVGHHVLFDIGMVNEALRRMGLGKLKNRYIDTAQLARRAVGGSDLTIAPGLSLDDLCRRYDIAPVDRHTAAGDAFLTALLFLKLLGKLKKRRVNYLRDLLR